MWGGAAAVAAALVTLLAANPCAWAGKTGKGEAAVVIAVSPAGNDHAAGTLQAPFRTLERAQQAVRLANEAHNVDVVLEDGIYRLQHPLVFHARDGGRDGYRVCWKAAPGAHPVISGAMRISGWRLFDRARQIYVADTPPGADSRELWVNDKLASVASMEIPRSSARFTTQGIVLNGKSYDRLARLPEQDRLQVVSSGFFTLRISPVEKVDGNTLVMQQPAWQNNLWGYDTIEAPFHPELAHLYLENSLAFLKQPGQWYLDPVAGKLYLRPPDGVDVNKMDVELPRLTVLLSVGDNLSALTQDLEFQGIRFSHTTWLGPSGNQGYASQQSGSYLAGDDPIYPSDPIKSCARGCPEFESRRNQWSQMPASVQVSAAQRITFDGDIFAHLGQYALGIGNDADATLSATGLGASDIVVRASVFSDDAGGAILAGGVLCDAHHPGDPRQIDRDLIVIDNRIHAVSKEYLDNSAILSTYGAAPIILHNDISDVPYDAIDIGYGWGIQDPGGNSNYRNFMHGYRYPQNPVYQTPTTYRGAVVASNRIHDAKQIFQDGGAIYNLSASPGTLITDNYIFDNHGRIALYLDEGSRYIMVRRNVVQDPTGEWLNINTVHRAWPLRISPDNTATGNWHDSSKIGGLWTNYQNDLILDDHLVVQGNWPNQAQQIMKDAGIEPSAGPVAYEEAQPDERH